MWACPPPLGSVYPQSTPGSAVTQGGYDLFSAIPFSTEQPDT